MIKTLKICIASLVFLIFSSVIEYFLEGIYVSASVPIIPLIIGVSFFIFSAFLACGGKEYWFLNIFSFFMNSVGLAFCIKSWYMFRGFHNDLWVMIGISGIASLFIWIFYLYSFFPGFKNSPKGYTFFFVFVFLFGYIALVALTTTTFVSTLGFYLIIEAGFLFASLPQTKSDKKLFRSITLSTFSVFVAAAIIAVAVLSEGDVDIDGSGLVEFTAESIETIKEEKQKEGKQL